MISIESITEEYKIRNAITDLSDYDFKLIKSIFKLKNDYANEISKRKSIIFLKEPIIVSVFDKSNIEKEKKKSEIKTKIEVSTNICEAVQMNGKNCKSKAKSGEKFCGRHCKK